MWHSNNPLVVKPGVVKIEKKIDVITLEVDELPRVLWSDYYPSDTESPLQSMKDFPASHTSLDTSTTISVSDPLTLLQSVERKSTFTFLKPYKCRIKNKARFDKIKDDPNNLLTGSATFHNFFDGMQTVDPITNQPRLPLMAIRPLEGDVREEYVGESPEKRQKLELELEFRNENIPEHIVLKDGSKKITDVKWESYIHVENAKKVLNGSILIESSTSKNIFVHLLEQEMLNSFHQITWLDSQTKLKYLLA